MRKSIRRKTQIWRHTSAIARRLSKRNSRFYSTGTSSMSVCQYFVRLFVHFYAIEKEKDDCFLSRLLTRDASHVWFWGDLWTNRLVSQWTSILSFQYITHNSSAGKDLQNSIHQRWSVNSSTPFLSPLWSVFYIYIRMNIFCIFCIIFIFIDFKLFALSHLHLKTSTWHKHTRSR